MAASSSLSVIATSSSSSPLFIHRRPSHRSSNPSNFLPPKSKRTKPLNLVIVENFCLSPLSRVFHLHLCHFSAAFNEIQDSGNQLEEEPVQVQELEGAEGEFEDEKRPERASADGRRIYVGNLSYSMSSTELAEILGEAGRVQSVELIYDRVTDRSRGFAFVTMGSVEEAEETIRMFDGSQIGGRTVKVNFPEVPRGSERKVMGPKMRSSYQRFVETPHKIYAGNLGWGLTSQGLRDIFACQPGFLSAKVIYERETGRSRGFGFVTFSSAEEAKSALDAMNGVEVEGRPLRLNMAAERARSSPAPEVDFNAEKSVDQSNMLSGISA
ncbi:hypothetical protein Nepgr_031728 [Nepenthes gracilis]|uniref:RRM domain-containing protein n=1 Tax=Nepenthes gracilis TaxID=150966 RepID=A0AAD3THA2_NEPGR|nr:hypothetical protein Nepgr_031728 [Nepenthes gracilis]